MKKILVVCGTRPEAIKMIPVVKELLRWPDKIDVKICTSGQHRIMLDQVMKSFRLLPDYDLETMRENQTLTTITCGVLSGMDALLKKVQPYMVLVHGDTTTTFAASLAAFYQNIRIGHVEAGLRTGDNHSPFPEELNRKLVAVMADLHFAPTTRARHNLLSEGVDNKRIVVTGNTVIDTLLSAREIIQGDVELKNALQLQFNFITAERRLLLVTGHRRESFGFGLETVCLALRKIAETYADIEIVYPVHLNPNVREPVQRILRGRKNIHLIEPLDYFSFVYLMMRAWIIVTDSGGIQEEAPSLGKPVLVTRETTERPECVELGSAALVGTDFNKIFEAVERLWRDPEIYRKMAVLNNPYGDGQAASRIVARIIQDIDELSGD